MFDIKIDKEAIEKQVADAIIKSSIGAEIEAAIKDQCSSYRLGNAIKSAVEKKIETVIANLLSTEPYAQQIRNAVTELLTQESVSEVSRKAWDALLDRMNRNL